VHPILFTIGDHEVRSAGVMYCVAIVATWIWALYIARRHGANAADVLPGLAVVTASAYAGARLLGALTTWQAFVGDPIGVLRVSNLSFFGGLALGVAALIAFIRLKGLPLGEAMDALAPIAPAVYALFRLGCLLNGDDYGRTTTMPWGMRFPNGSPPALTPVHPVQIYEILLMVPLFLWLLWRPRDRRPHGAIAFETAVLLGTERFFVDFWRPSDVAGAGLLLSQWLALSLTAVGITGLLALVRIRKRRLTAGLTR
jgi:phosphatidylglycerol:prolipoprotein diacylglycerol transferase